MKQKIILIVGPSGSGKSYLENHLVSDFGYSKIVSFTTRQPRKGEENGRDYWFVSKEVFDSYEKIESVHFAGNYYAVPAFEIKSKKSDIVLVVEPDGLKQILDYCRSQWANLDPKVIFFDIPSDVRRGLMYYRGDTDDVIKSRLEHDDIKNQFLAMGVVADVTIGAVLVHPAKYVVEQLVKLRGLTEVLAEEDFRRKLIEKAPGLMDEMKKSLKNYGGVNGKT